MITELGKFLRKLRIDHGEILYNMATKLGVSISFLSSVETGKKNMPSEWIDKLSVLYSLSDDQRSILQELTRDAVTTVKINLINQSAPRKKAALTFARSFGSLTDKEAEDIINYFNNKDERNY